MQSNSPFLPRISIITPSYNQGCFIEDAIQSVLSQEYSDIEHIIIDGGSTDNTIDVLKKYPHLLWISEPDEGQSDALNKGFKLATGDIVGWLNADDLYLPDTLKRVNESLQGASDAVYGNYRFINKEGDVTKHMRPIGPSRMISLFNCFIPSTTFFFKRKIIDAGILIDVDFEISMDKEFFAHILHKGYHVKKINYFLAHFRWHDSNKSINTKAVKRTTAREGVRIFSRYTGIHLPVNEFTATTYRYVALMVNVLRALKGKMQ